MPAHKAVKALARPELYPLYLYKRILSLAFDSIVSRLHYGLPPPARIMGDTYVKDEFRRHKDATPEQTAVFVNEWTNYCVTLAKQLSQKGIVKGFIGKDLEPEKLDSFAEDQLRQLLDLKLESERMAKGESTKVSEKSSAKQTNE
ncbi:unnamed protein product [Strongylus vulgaris]|uniref:Succinate dehydrogenase assembly factor 3 n=1 Tax=Strongylus vulgaris TaxID=40348 RepID=A0A3P7IIU2_STRVU|nr:unnamed protein product [Strongylus vulgaris]